MGMRAESISNLCESNMIINAAFKIQIYILKCYGVTVLKFIDLE